MGELAISTNILVAAFTSCHAQVKLDWRRSVPLLTRVLYMDRDSVIYLVTEGESPLLRG